jgi:hypothetical protein
MKNTIAKENVVSIRLRDLETSTLFSEIQAPFFKNVSLVRFSPSGRYLLVGNENCQFFYLYEILPVTNQRFNAASAHKNSCETNFCHQDRVRLVYSLFRGYSSAVVTDVQFIS